MSAIRSMLVHFDAHPSSVGRLKLARDLAGQHGASVAAAYGVPMSLSDVAASTDGTPAGWIEYQAIHAERQRGAFELFEAAVKEPGPSVHWIDLQRMPKGPLFSHHALFADLLVLGARTPGSWFARATPVDVAETVSIASGKPALIVPHGFSTCAHRIVVAWQAGREAMRALTASIPFLQKADEVHLAHWNEPESESPDFPALQHYLRLHDVESTCHEFGRADAVGEAMLELARELHADLLVMGCYSHSRLREFVLGGVTRTVLASPTLPVLVAH
jgi:nucleotide-binding universal stress UspA family protein